MKRTSCWRHWCGFQDLQGRSKPLTSAPRALTHSLLTSLSSRHACAFPAYTQTHSHTNKQKQVSLKTNKQKNKSENCDSLKKTNIGYARSLSRTQSGKKLAWKMKTITAESDKSYWRHISTALRSDAIRKKTSSSVCLKGCTLQRIRGCSSACTNEFTFRLPIFVCKMNVRVSGQMNLAPMFKWDN